MGVQLKGLGRSAWRRLLELDRPVPERSPAEIEVEVQANYRWNFTVSFLDGAWFWFGAAFISAGTILPLFVSKLTTDPFWFALLAVISSASWYLPQLLTVGATERLARKKPVVVNLGFFTERLPMLLLPVAALLALRAPLLALILFFVGYAWHGFGAGAIAAAWSDMIARVFPVARRGWFFGFTAFIGSGLGALGAIFSGWLLEKYPYPLNFALVFGIAAICVSLSWACLALTREPAERPLQPVTPQRVLSTRKLMLILRGDRNFRNYLFSRLLGALGRMGAGFLTVAAIERFAVSDMTVGIFTVALLVGQTVGNLLAGVMADRRGHKLTMALSLLVGAASFILAYLATSADWYYPVFFLSGMANGMVVVSGVLIVMEFSLAEHRPTYIGIGNTTAGTGSAVAPIIGGVIAAFSYSALFAVSAIVGLIAFAVLQWFVREPRHQAEYFDLALFETARQEQVT